MKREQIKQLREKTLADLKKELGETRKELFHLEMDGKVKKIKNVRKFYHKRKEIKVIKTIIREKEENQ